MSNKKQYFARFGIASKGIVYIILSLLTLLSAINAGGSQSGSRDAIKFLHEQPYGVALLILIAIGLLGYVFWKFYQGITNPEEKSNDAKGIITRISYLIGGTIYGALSLYALKLALGSQDRTTSNSTSLFSNDIVLWIIGIILIAKGIYEIYQAYSHKYKEDLEQTDLSADVQSKLLKWGRFGYTMRGIVFLIAGYLTITSRDSELSSKTDVFSYISTEYGIIPLIIITFGLLGYGVFLVIKSKYTVLKM